MRGAHGARSPGEDAWDGREAGMKRPGKDMLSRAKSFPQGKMDGMRSPGEVGRDVFPWGRQAGAKARSPGEGGPGQKRVPLGNVVRSTSAFPWGSWSQTGAAPQQDAPQTGGRHLSRRRAMPVVSTILRTSSLTPVILKSSALSSDLIIITRTRNPAEET